MTNKDIARKISILSDLHDAWELTAKQYRESIYIDNEMRVLRIVERRRSQANLRALIAELEAS